MPIVTAIGDGFRALGHDCRAFRIADRYWVHLHELEAFEAELVLLPLCRKEWLSLALPYKLELSRRTCAALNFDDPYDHETGLQVARFCDHTFTPEELALDIYRRDTGRGASLLPPFISGRMHPPREYDCGEDLGVFWFGGTHWTPRKTILPRVRAWCQANGHRYGEVAGRKRWLAGRELTRALHGSRLTFEIPRFDLPTVSNPHQIPCTYTGPRLHIAAATKTFAIVCKGKPDNVYPMYPRCAYGDELLEALEHFLDDRERGFREAITDAALEEWREHHSPRVRAETMLSELELAGVVSLGAPVSGADQRRPSLPRAQRACSDRPGAETAGA